MRQDLGNLTRLAGQIDGEADLSDLAKSAEAAAETGRVLAEKQAEALENVSQELLHSPEIIKCEPPPPPPRGPSLRQRGIWKISSATCNRDDTILIDIPVISGKSSGLTRCWVLE